MYIFSLGQIVTTNSVATLMSSNWDFKAFVFCCMDRYIKHDWGELCEDDRKKNDHAVQSDDTQIFAVYEFPQNASWNTESSWVRSEKKLWIITEGDRSVTTILFPSDY